MDPYFLYAASNVGSFASLVLYPTVIEPSAGALHTDQRLGVRLQPGCPADPGLRRRDVAAHTRRIQRTAHASSGADTEVVTWSRRARWIALAFVPSSLMLAVTAYISTDVAAVPLLWVIPLALYLITFVVGVQLVFAPRGCSLQSVSSRWCCSSWRGCSPARRGCRWRRWPATHLAAFTVLAILCHGFLAADRPSTGAPDRFLPVARDRRRARRRLQLAAGAGAVQERARIPDRARLRHPGADLHARFTTAAEQAALVGGTVDRRGIDGRSR